jgi:prepilin-type N-terminal cleavage/methylation domain-containing protein
MSSAPEAPKAFSLVEVIIVVAVIGILAAFIISSLSGTSEYAHQVVARQEQAELQTALGNWIAAASSDPGGLANARWKYTNTADKLLLLSNYLQDATYQRLRLTSTGPIVRSPALTASKARLEFSSSWSTADVPSVNWINTSP